MKELVSIVIPVYNVEKYIDQCLDCITNQTYKNIQIIVINDGSTDSTKEKLKRWEKNDNRITVINKKNEGVSIARNCGIDSAYGKYIFFFDGDDTVELDCINRVVSYAEEKEYDTVLYGYASIRENGNIFKHSLSYSSNEYLSNLDVINFVIPHSIGISYLELTEWLKGKRSIRQGKDLTGPWRMCYSLKLIKKNNILFDKNLKVGEDTIFTNLYLSYAERVGILDECLYYLHNHSDSTIGMYLEDVFSMIDNKKNLIKAKRKLSDLIKRRTDCDITSWWGGEVILSTIEIAWLLTNKQRNKSCIERYKMLKDFIDYEYVAQCWDLLKLNWCFSIKVIPIILIKSQMKIVLFAIMSALRRLGCKITRM
ncbi:glycosyltransferase family 2 protein [Clostridium beijerinckii]|uniref:glycosyltransferase family 2 protein n=1 Tax=Clostridium beijerinckii TaxID=1520 RepID=UPI0022E58EEF|nr:glycosyltransferase family 2 protein [Clostridium beijerinckii]